jgi:hypothetical protein
LAIGTFVDNVSTALKIYALQSKNPIARQSRIMRAWGHALEHLSGRMTRDEAHRTWKRKFQQDLPEFEIPSPDREVSTEYPVFPFAATIGHFTDWNPLDTFDPPPAVKARFLQPLTFLDLSLSSASLRVVLGETFPQSRLETVGFQPPLIYGQ